jgi:hypothetical protein
MTAPMPLPSPAENAELTKLKELFDAGFIQQVRLLIFDGLTPMAAQ